MFTFYFFTYEHVDIPNCAIIPQFHEFQHIPAEFWRSNCLNKKTSVNLRYPSGKKWLVELKFYESAGNNRAMIARGWRQFYESNKLRIGDVCTFELNHNAEGSTVASMNVHIFPASN